MDMDLKHHKRGFASVNAHQTGLVVLSRWYNGNPVGTSIYEFDPDEAERAAALLLNAAAEAKASPEERERFEEAREKAIAETGFGTAPSFTAWHNSQPLSDADIDRLYSQANEILDRLNDPLAGQLGGHQSFCHAVKEPDAECDCKGYGEYVAAED